MKEKINAMIQTFLDTKKEYEQKINAEPNSVKRFQSRLPNILTMCRPLSLLFILPIAFLGNFKIALILSGLSALTDFFDGIVARKYHAESSYGKKLDPICDKIFAVGLSLPILSVQPLLILSTIAFEGIIAAISLKSEIRKNHPVPTRLGKKKTWALGIELFTLYLTQALKAYNIIMPIPILAASILTTNGMQFATAIQYQKIDHQKQEEKKKKVVEKQQLQPEIQLTKSEKIHQEILEYQSLKASLEEEPSREIKDKTKTIGSL